METWQVFEVSMVSKFTQGISPGKDGDFRGGLPKKNDEQIGIDFFFSEIEWNRMG